MLFGSDRNPNDLSLESQQDGYACAGTGTSAEHLPIYARDLHSVAKLVSTEHVKR